MIATEQYVHVVLFSMLHKVVLTRKPLDESPVCDHSNESFEQYVHVVPFGTVRGDTNSLRPCTRILICDHWKFESTTKFIIRFLCFQDWQTVDREAFTIRANNQRSFNLKEVIEQGNYNTLMQNQPLYNSEAHTFESSHNLFRSAFNEGFPWELIEVFSGNEKKICLKDPPQTPLFDTWPAETGRTLGREITLLPGSSRLSLLTELRGRGHHYGIFVLQFTLIL